MQATENNQEAARSDDRGGSVEENREPWRQDLERAKRLVGGQLADLLVDWDFENLPDEVVGSFWSYSGWIFHDHASPFKDCCPVSLKEGLKIQFGLHGASSPSESDVVVYKWVTEQRPLRVVMSLNAMQVDFALDQIVECTWSHGPACVQAARKWVEQTLKLEGEHRGTSDSVIQYRVDLPWPEKLADGVWFSSAPDLDINRLFGMPRWYWRVDAFVEDGVLSILIYKKVGQLMGYQDGSKWFPDEFRAQVLKRARAQGKLPEASVQSP